MRTTDPGFQAHLMNTLGVTVSNDTSPLFRWLLPFLRFSQCLEDTILYSYISTTLNSWLSRTSQDPPEEKIVTMGPTYWYMSEFCTPAIRAEQGVVPTDRNPIIPSTLGTSFPYTFYFVVRGLPTKVIIEADVEGRTALYVWGPINTQET